MPKAIPTNFREFWDTHSIYGNPIDFYLNHPDVDEEDRKTVTDFVNGKTAIDQDAVDWMDEQEDTPLSPLFMYFFAHHASIEEKSDDEYEDCADFALVLIEEPELFWPFFLDKENEVPKKTAWNQIAYSVAWQISADKGDSREDVEENKNNVYDEWRAEIQDFSNPIKQLVEKFITDVDHSISMQRYKSKLPE
jgi:hypothetical protein